jgi:GNAT superfamily N-acetyltransferase
MTKGLSSTFVVAVDETSPEVLGFYAISLAELVNAELPEQYRKRLPVKVPVFCLGRLAIDRRHQGKGMGEHLLFDAIDRVTCIAKEVGGIGLVVDAKRSAIGFYERYGFEPMADHPQNLFLSF